MTDELQALRRQYPTDPRVLGFVRDLEELLAAIATYREVCGEEIERANIAIIEGQRWLADRQAAFERKWGAVNVRRVRIG